MLTTAPNYALGNLHTPGSIQMDTVPGGGLRWLWTGELVGDHCAATDTIQGVILPQNVGGYPLDPTHFRTLSGTRRRSQYYEIVTGLAVGVQFVSFVWFRHAAAEDSRQYASALSQVSKTTS